MNDKYPLKSEGRKDGFKDEESRDKKISQHFRKLWLAKRIRIAGSIPTGGRPEYVYCQHNIPNHLLTHEVEATDFYAAIGFLPCRRFLDVDPRFNLDGELSIGDQLYGVEWDTGEMRRQQVERRWKKLSRLDYPLLIITCDEDRLKDLFEWSDLLGDCAHFTTKKDAIERPWDDIWIDLNGDYFSIEKPGI